MTDFTPEQLDRLEATAQRWIDTDGDMYDDDGKVSAVLEALPLLVTAVKERNQLRGRQQELLAAIAKISQTTPFPEELIGWEAQRAAMIAEIGTLRASLAKVTSQRDQLHNAREAYLSSALERRYPAMAAELAGAKQLAIEAVRLASKADVERDEWRRRAEAGRAAAVSTLLTGFCAQLAYALGMPATSTPHSMDAIQERAARLLAIAGELANMVDTTRYWAHVERIRPEIERKP